MQTAGQLMTLPMSSYKKMKCNTCEGYLSIPPVDLTRKICGRCNGTRERSVEYEEIAQYVMFPCIYPKCGEKIAWGEVKAHENKCIHKTSMCPVEACHQKYRIIDMTHHFQKSHKMMKKSGSPVIKITPNSNTNYFNGIDKQIYQIDYMGQGFLVFAYGIPCNKIYGGRNCAYYFGVFALNPDYQNNKKFEITLDMECKDNESVSYSQKDKKVLQFDERAHCFRCISAQSMRGSCPTYHKQGVNFLPVDFGKIDMGSSKSQTYTVHIKPDGQRDKLPNKYIAKKMECPICLQYMSAPIYICETGHTICKNCKQSLANCPYCKAHLGDKRNFTLEDLAETIKELM